MYSEAITRATPTSFIFMLDQSGSMSEPWSRNETVDKAAAVAKVVNRMLFELINLATKPDVRDYYHVAVIGYGSRIGSCLGGALRGRDFVGTSQLAEHPQRVDTLTQRQSDGAGGLVSVDVQLPVWVDPVASGGTPMSQAFSLACRLVGEATERNPRSFPPMVINITDGRYTDSDPSEVVRRIMRLATEDGAALVVNVHISGFPGEPTVFPASADGLEDPYAAELFEMSSELPEPMRLAAHDHGFALGEGARAFAFNADLTVLTQVLDVGTSGTMRRLLAGFEEP